MAGKLTSASSIARTLGVTEGSVRYHLRRQAARAVDGTGDAKIAREASLGRLRWPRDETVQRRRGPKRSGIMERLRDLASRILRVPKEELPVQRGARAKKKKRKRGRGRS